MGDDLLITFGDTTVLVEDGAMGLTTPAGPTLPHLPGVPKFPFDLPFEPKPSMDIPDFEVPGIDSPF